MDKFWKSVSNGISNFIVVALLIAMIMGAMWFMLWTIDGLVMKVIEILAR